MSLTRSDAALELGRRLVTMLNVEDDLLASWMAHDIAARIESAEKAPPDTREAARESCASSILRLWEHRESLPKHLRPFKELEPIARALTSLDVSQTDHHYYPSALRAAADVSNGESKRQIELALGLDYSARLLIEAALRTAAEHAASTAEAWVELARQAGARQGYELPIIEFVLDGEPRKDPKRAELERHKAKLQDRLSRLEAFVELAGTLANDLRTQIGSIPD